MPVMCAVGVKLLGILSKLKASQYWPVSRIYDMDPRMNANTINLSELYGNNQYAFTQITLFFECFNMC